MITRKHFWGTSLVLSLLVLCAALAGPKVPAPILIMAAVLILAAPWDWHEARPRA